MLTETTECTYAQCKMVWCLNMYALKRKLTHYIAQATVETCSSDDLLKLIFCWLPRRFLEFSPPLILPSEWSRYAPSQWPSLQALQIPAEPVDLARRDADGGSLVSIVQLCKGILPTTRPHQSFMEAPFLPADVYSHTTSCLQAFNTAMRPLVAG